MNPRSEAAPGRDALAAHLHEEILAGRLAVGSRLPSERELANEFKLSRPIVREVLRGLQERGLVEILPARGTFVRAPTAMDGARSLDASYRRLNPSAREVMEARLMLETHTARLAALNATARDVAALEACLAESEAAESFVDRARQDITLHAVLARTSRNALIETMFASIARLVFELMLRSQADPPVVERGMPFHRRLVEAVRARDPDAAEAAMRGHLELAATLHGPDYERGVETVARRELRRLAGPRVSLEELLDDVARRIEAVTGRP